MHLAYNPLSRESAMIHILRGSAVLLGLLLCTLLPFAAGRHDVFAVPVSAFAQGLGLGSLLLVPVGVVWLLHGLLQRAGDPGAGKVRRRYAVLALVLLAVIGLLAALLAGTQWGISLGVMLAVVWVTILWRAARSSRARVSAAPGPDRVTPLFCILVPGVYLLLWIVVAGPAAEFARDRAIQSSETLIADIEQFRAARGHYPLSLHSLWEDYSPSVLGIDRYFYEPHGDAYNLFFEQPTLELGARVIVMFNPRDEQVMSSHNSDLLRLAPDDLERQRGFIAVRPAAQPHWKSFVFD